MKNKKSSFSPAVGEIPSPEELFHKKYKKNQDEAVSVTLREPIPHYRIVKQISIGFCIFIILLVLFLVNLDKFGINFYFMRSSSMESVIPKGSILMTRKVPPEKLVAGDIITFNNANGKSVTHEIEVVIPIYKDGQPGYWTKGTNNSSIDKISVSYKDVCGKVIFHIPYIGRIFMGKG